MQKTNIKILLKSIFLIAILGLSAMAIAEWTPPTKAPTEGNVPPPVNVGTTGQMKNGSLGVTGLISSGKVTGGQFCFLVGGAEVNCIAGNWPTGAGGGTVTSVFGRTGAITAFSGDYDVSKITGAAPIASPLFTGDPRAPTPLSTDKSTSIATTEFVKNAVSAGGSSQWTTSGSNIYYNSGNVGIGTASPSYKFEIIDNNRDSVGMKSTGINNSGQSGAAKGVYGIAKSTGGSTTGAYGIYGEAITTQPGANIGVYGIAYNATNSYNIGGYFIGSTKTLANTLNAGIVFGSAGTQTISNGTWGMQQTDSYPNLLRGKTSIGGGFPSRSDESDWPSLNVVGNIRFSGPLLPNGSAGTAGQVLTSNGSGSAPTWQTPATPSDIRIKKDITDSDLGLDFVNKLRPVSFKLINNNEDKINYGFIAQEVEFALDGKDTDIVLTGADKDKMKSMTYTSLIAPMVQAIQEQQKQIEELKKEIEILKNK